MCRGWTRDGLSRVSTSVPFPSLQRSHGEKENIIPLIVTRVTLSLDCVAARQIGISLPAATMFAKLSPVRGGREERKERNRKWNASFDEQKQRNVNWSIYISGIGNYRFIESYLSVKVGIKGGLDNTPLSSLGFIVSKVFHRRTCETRGRDFWRFKSIETVRRSLPSLAYRTWLINLLNRSIN